jgi:hypothetical protein
MEHISTILQRKLRKLKKQRLENQNGNNAKTIK